MQGTFDRVATFVAKAAITRNARVAIDTTNSGVPAQVILAGANVPAIGIAEYSAAIGDEVAVRLYGSGTMQMIAAVTFAQGAKVYGAASGKIGTTATSTTIVGHALEAATEADDIVHVAPFGAEVAQ